MKQFSPDYLSDLTEQAKTNDRLRQHRNIHQSFQDPCQRLFNAIEPGSYIRPHRHASDPRDELLVAIRGLMALITFDDNGTVTNVLRLGTEKYGPATCPAAEVPSDVWHTVIALESGWRKFNPRPCWCWVTPINHAMNLLDQIDTDANLPARCRGLFEREFSVEQAVRQIVLALSV